MIEQIKKFIGKRPKPVAVYGYGSGIFKQKGYTEKDKPQIDLIIVVDDLRKWHLENMKLNRKDYSLIGKAFFKHASINKLKGCTGVTYVSNIEEDGNIFKYGTIEEKDLIENLKTWKSFYTPGRFQKTVYPIKESKKLTEAIEANRRSGLLVATYLQDKPVVTRKDIYVTLCGLSYLGDTRMKFAENPRKVLNIVEGSYDQLDEIYSFETDYLTGKDEVTINQDIVKAKLDQLPKELLLAIQDTLYSDDEANKEKILKYFEELNKRESASQTIKGIKTNGIIRSISYASKKLGKRFKK